jgi:hypothetical protein
MDNVFDSPQMDWIGTEKNLKLLYEKMYNNILFYEADFLRHESPARATVLDRLIEYYTSTEDYERCGKLNIIKEKLCQKKK